MTSLRHNPHDLAEEYSLVFCRQGIFGRKAHLRPWEEFDSFVTRSRYLLTTVEDSYLDDLFNHKRIAPATVETGFTGEAFVTAAWIAGLQKNRAFIAQIDDLINTETRIGYYSPAWYAAGLLFDDPQLHTLYRRAFDRKENCIEEGQNSESWSGRADPRALAIVCLELIDQRHGTRFSDPVPQDLGERQRNWARNRISRVLDVSNVLRAGFDIVGPEDLKSKLKTFLAASTSFDHHAAGATKPVHIRAHAGNTDLNAMWQEKRNAFAEENKTCAKFGVSPPRVRVQNFNDDWHCLAEQNRPRARNDDICRRHVQAYLMSSNSDLFWLWVGGRAATSFVDILGALELDLHYRLPANFVDFLYEKLAGMISFNADAMTQHAYDLLLRSGTYDDKARRLLQSAEALRMLSIEHDDYPGVQMTAAWG